jgi:hypothetical protein
MLHARYICNGNRKSHSVGLVIGLKDIRVIIVLHTHCEIQHNEKLFELIYVVKAHSLPHVTFRSHVIHSEKVVFLNCSEYHRLYACDLIIMTSCHKLDLYGWIIVASLCYCRQAGNNTVEREMAFNMQF